MKSPKTNTLADRLVERTSSLLEVTGSKGMHKDKDFSMCTLEK